MDDLGEDIGALRTWSRVARAAIAIFLVMLAVLIIGNGLLLFAELSRDSGSVEIWRAESYAVERVSVYNGLLAIALGGSVLLIGSFFVLAAVPVAIWIYRAHANLHEAGSASSPIRPAGRSAATSCRWSTS